MVGNKLNFSGVKAPNPDSFFGLNIMVRIKMETLLIGELSITLKIFKSHLCLYKWTFVQLAGCSSQLCPGEEEVFRPCGGCLCTVSNDEA